MTAEVYRAQCNACLAHDSLNDLPKLTMPVLVAAGDSDLMMTLEKTYELVHGLPNAQLYLCEKGGHVHEWEQLAAYNAVTLAFLREHDSQAHG